MPWPLFDGSGPSPGKVLLPPGAEVAATSISNENPRIRAIPVKTLNLLNQQATIELPPQVPKGWREDSWQTPWSMDGESMFTSDEYGTGGQE